MFRLDDQLIQLANMYDAAMLIYNGIVIWDKYSFLCQTSLEESVKNFHQRIEDHIICRVDISPGYCGENVLLVYGNTWTPNESLLMQTKYSNLQQYAQYASVNALSTEPCYLKLKLSETQGEVSK